MPTFLLLHLVTPRSIVRSRVDLQLENLTLRHQISMLQCLSATSPAAETEIEEAGRLPLHLPQLV